MMRKRELIEWAIYLPYDKIMTTPDAPKQAVRYLLTAICDALASVELDTTALEGQIDSIAEAVCDDSEMLRVPDIIWGDGPSWAVFETYFASRRNTKHPPKTARVLLPASEIGGPPSRFVKRPATLRRQAKPSRRRMPAWKAPKNMARALDNGDGIWEDARWEPLQLTAMSGTSYAGQDIPVIWQVEFDPSDDDFETANARLENSGITPDGYGWGRHIQNAIGMSDPALAARLQLGDCETSTCVIWVTSVDDCLRLIETTWGLIFGQ
ncbi:MAG: hypothetical protein JSS02_24695 [Planctomycetes bacterium]|nr:hypothetical protein [Planctomycetota bacterium]